ncbi:reverse transcriptase domain-containing protein, partial [Tanacetum coccineum]
TKTRFACKSISQTKQQGDKVAENASNKRKWEGNHNGRSSQQQNKEHKVFRAHTVGPRNKKKYSGSIPLRTKCNYHHNGQCAPKCDRCKKVGHLAQDCRNYTIVINQGTRTCFKCRKKGYYKSDCPKLKNRNHENQAGGTKACGIVYALGGGETI